MRRIPLRLGIFVLVVLPIYEAAQKDEDLYTRIFTEPCPNRFHPTFRHQQPYLIDLEPGGDGFQHPKLCSMAFTADPVRDENGDNVLVCFQVLQFTFCNCSIELKMQDIEQKKRYFKPQSYPTNEQECFWGTTVSVHIRSPDFFNCDPSTKIRIEVTARNANAYDDGIMSTGNWITMALLIAVSAIGVLSLSYYKYRYKARNNTPTLGRTHIPDEDSRDIAPRHNTCSLDRRPRPSPSATSRLHNDQRISATNGSCRTTESRRTHGNRNQRGSQFPQTSTGQAQSRIAGRETPAERSGVHRDIQVPRDNLRAPPPSYEECMATTDTESHVLRHVVVNDADFDVILMQEEEITDESPPPYPGL